jgi:GH15 family glucan-1,4-alpha-glucosidase
MRPATNGGTGEPFAPIAEYGFLSDAETTALLAPSGNVEWMCLPRVDSPSVFGSLLDRDAGYFRVGPPPAATFPERSCWRPPGGRPAAGWSSSTLC